MTRTTINRRQITTGLIVGATYAIVGLLAQAGFFNVVLLGLGGFLFSLLYLGLKDRLLRSVTNLHGGGENIAQRRSLALRIASLPPLLLGFAAMVFLFSGGVFENRGFLVVLVAFSVALWLISLSLLWPRRGR